MFTRTGEKKTRTAKAEKPAPVVGEGEPPMLFWTASFYVTPEDLPRGLREAIAAGQAADASQPHSLQAIQDAHKPSRLLSETVDPLLNDISTRETQSQDYLFASSIERHVDVSIRTPGMIPWDTEGYRVECHPPDDPRDMAGNTHPARVRRFWYLQGNGALSWHVSFETAYSHLPSDYFFLMMLQKVLAPKEFAPDKRIAPTLRVHRPEGKTGIVAIDEVKINQSGRERPFWTTLGEWFADDFRDLEARLTGPWREKQAAAPKRRGVLDVLAPPQPPVADTEREKKIAADPFGELVRREVFPEIPGLEMPRVRTMFFFRDETLFTRLMPRNKEGARISRSEAIDREAHREVQRAFERLKIDQGKPALMNAAYWKSLEDEQDCIDYLFLSGFTQNIIDFMNQDASEVLDSIDPIYPATDEQDSEGFFIRFANTRSLTTFVASSRSLKSARDWIGNCPYALLIHVTVLHNEFLSRDTALLADAASAKIAGLEGRNRVQQAAQAVYDFRSGPMVERFRNTYENIFRYDTEGDVFEALKKKRWERLVDKLKETVANLENKVDQWESAMRDNRERGFTLAIGFFSLFGLLQIVLQIAQFQNEPKAGGQDGVPLPEWMAWLFEKPGAIYATIILSLLILVIATLLLGRHMSQGMGKLRDRKRRSDQ